MKNRRKLFRNGINGRFMEMISAMIGTISS